MTERKNNPSLEPTVEPFSISRVLNAPRDFVFKSFTEPEKMKKWWGPKDFTVLVSKMDFRPGGIYHYGLQSPDGEKMWGRFVYREIVTPERLVYVNSFSDEAGNVTRHPWSQNWPLEMLSTTTFTEEHDGKTTFMVKWTPLCVTALELKTFNEGRGSIVQGWTGTLDQFEEYLTKELHG